MRLSDLQSNWDRWGRIDPLYAVATAPQYKGGGWDERAFFATGEDNVDRLMETLDRVAPGLRRDDALDFGCGVGRLTLALARRFRRVVGVDIAPSMIDRAEGYNVEPERVSYVLNTTADLGVFSDRSFDLVYSDITLLHMEPQYSIAYLREFLRIVRVGGVAVFQLPSPTPRQKIRDRIPRPLVDIGNRILTLRKPKMEVYGVEPDVVQQVVEAAGGRLLASTSSPAATFDAADNRYFVGTT